MNFKSKLQNFWYYYKYYLLIGTVLIFALFVAINSCVNRKNYDLNILYVSYGYSDSFFQSGELISLFDGFAPDKNGDGISETQIITINYGTTFQESNSAGAQRSANLASGKALLFLLDERNYQELKAAGFLENIENLGQSDFVREDAFLAYDSGLLDNISGFKSVNRPYYLCLRKYDEARAGSDSDFKAEYDSAEQTLINIINNY